MQQQNEHPKLNLKKQQCIFVHCQIVYPFSSCQSTPMVGGDLNIPWELTSSRSNPVAQQQTARVSSLDWCRTNNNQSIGEVVGQGGRILATWMRAVDFCFMEAPPQLPTLPPPVLGNEWAILVIYCRIDWWIYVAFPLHRHIIADEAYLKSHQPEAQTLVPL